MAEDQPKTTLCRPSYGARPGPEITISRNKDAEDDTSNEAGCYTVEKDDDRRTRSRYR